MSAAAQRRFVATILVLITSEGAVRSDDATGPGSTVVIVRDCRMEFVATSVLSVERTGVIEHIVEEGDTVDSGAIVIQLNDDVAQAAVELAEHEAEGEIKVEVARKAAEAAAYEFELAESANLETPAGRTPPVPMSELTRLRMESEQAKLEVEVAEHELESHRLELAQSLAELNTYRVLAPQGGMITHAYHRLGETVQQGDPILEIVQTDTIRVEGRISLTESHLVSAGMPIRLMIASPGKETPEPIDGVLGFVDVTVIQSLQEVRVWADVPNTGNWRAGLPCEMEILLPAADSPAVE